MSEIDSSLNRLSGTIQEEYLFDTFLSMGADLQNEYLFDFHFIGSNDRLNKIERILFRNGFVKKQEDSGEGELILQLRAKLGSMKSRSINDTLNTLADHFNVEYHGWSLIYNRVSRQFL